jgi:hypothetical protein
MTTSTAADPAAARQGGSSPRASSRRIAVLLVVASLVVYNANGREISSADTIGTRLLPAAVLLGDGFTLDRYYHDERELPYWVQRAGSHYVSSYPVVPGLLAVPIYALPVLAFGDGSWALINFLAKLSASLLAALSVGLVYLALREVAPGSVALGITLAYAFATPTWSVSSQGLWGHAPAQLFLAAGIYCALRAAADPRYLAAGGVAAGLMLASRPTTAVIAAALLGYGLARDRRAGLTGLLGCALVLLPVVAYNVRYFGSIQGGYAELHAAHPVHHGVATAWTASLSAGLAGLLVSPSRGLLVYSPVLALALAGLVRGGVSVGRPVGGWLVAGLAGSLLLLGSFSVWWGGHSYGPRLLADFLPGLVLLAVPGWQALASRRWGRSALAGLVAASVAVQIVGAYYYPSPRDVDWNTTPRDVDQAHERLWDWRDTQLGRLLRNGPQPFGFGA